MSTQDAAAQSSSKPKIYAFYCCEELESIKGGNGLESIGEMVFPKTAVYDNEANRENGVLYSKHFQI